MASTALLDHRDRSVRTAAERLLAALVRLNQPILDRRLADGADPARSAALTRRARELGEPRTAAEVAGRLESILREVDRPPAGLSARAPLQRAQIAAARPFLANLVDRLRDAAEPSPTGVAQAMVLLTDGAGPIYAPAHPGTLAARAWRAAHAL